MKKFILSEIEFSRNDERRNLKLPEKLTPELAEDIGIMVGDGHISICRRPRRTDYEISCTGHIITDNIFVKRHVKNLKLKLFNLDFSFFERPRINTCVLRTRSMGLLNFYHLAVGLPLGSKQNINIPKLIMKSDSDIKKSFLRGFSDTDFTLIFKRGGKNVLHYPLLKLGTSSKNLVLDLKEVLISIGFKPTICCDMNVIHSKTKREFTTHQIYLQGKKNLEKWIKEIGFNNPKNILRYNLWKEKGFSLPNEEIEKIMSGPEEI